MTAQLGLPSTISLPEFVRTFFAAEPAELPADALEAITGVRNVELRLRRWLPARLVRRLDRGFGRSNTVAPDTARSLYAHARAAHACVIFETGTYWGYSTAVLAAAIRDNGGGTVHSFDRYARAGAHIPAALRPWITLHLGRPSVESLPPVLESGPPDLFFQDSQHDYDGVAGELRLVGPRLRPSGMVLLHDWMLDDVRRAVADVLAGWTVLRIAGDDPQQLGVAIKPRQH